MANPFKWEHIIYLFAGLAIGALLGYLVGIFVFPLLVSAATYNANATQASFYIARYSQIPMQATLVGMALGTAFGFVYSHEKYEKEEKASQLPVIVLPQASGSQAPIILVHQQPQQPQTPYIVMMPQAGQQPIVVTPQQAQQQK